MVVSKWWLGEISHVRAWLLAASTPHLSGLARCEGLPFDIPTHLQGELHVIVQCFSPFRGVGRLGNSVLRRRKCSSIAAFNNADVGIANYVVL
jgi:hypothetical protein